MEQSITIKPTLKNTLQRWKEIVVAKANEWAQRSDTRGIRSPHFWIITVLIAFGALNYYLDQTPLINLPLFNHSFFTSVHDVHRTLFFIPIIYAALVFRVRGSLIASLAFLCVVLPRALLFSPYPDPLLRPILFVIFAAIISTLMASHLNQVEKERSDRVKLSEAYQKLSEYHQRLKESQEQLIQAEKLTSLGQLAASIAHEVNNPLAGVLIYTQLMAKKINDDKLAKEVALDYLSKMDSELTRSTRLIRNLLDFARQSTPTLREVNVNEVITRAIELAAHSAELGNVQMIKELDPALPRLMADFDQLQQVCTNLILNAIQAMPEGGILTLRTSTPPDNDSQLKIEVQDTGLGISPENMRRLFTPFFTTKKKGKGVGLGLAVAYGIVQRHKGRIEVQSREGEGTTFIIYLPLRYEKHEEKD